MKITSISFLFAMLLMAACGTKETATSPVFIRDSVQVLTQRQYDDLARQIKTLEDSVGSQLGVIIIKSLRDEAIEAYSLRNANAVGLGRKEFNDGVLITVAIDDRQMRIEVGTGLEGIITNELAAEIIRDEMSPEFQKARYYEGLSKAIDHISSLILENRTRIGQPPPREASETIALDDFLIDEITDTAVQELSGSLVMLVQPSDQQLAELSGKYEEEELSTILDDASFYQSEAAALFDTLNVNYVVSEKRFVRYRNIIREWNLDLEKKYSPWILIFFHTDRKPEVVLTTELDEAKVKEYFDLD